MSELRYQRRQLQLIAATYEARGYSVALDVAVPETNWRFDAVAKSVDGAVVVIELVNARRGEGDRDARLAVLRRAAAMYPNASVDLRYIDFEQSDLLERADRVGQPELNAGVALDALNKVMKIRLPRRPSPSRIALVRSFLDLWSLHAAAVQAFAQLALEDAKTSDSRGLLEQYDNLLKSDLLIAPEQAEDDATLDLRDLHRIAAALLQGGQVDAAEVAELRAHVREVRRQIRRWKSATNKTVTAKVRGTDAR